MDKEFCKEWWQHFLKSLILSVLSDHLLHKSLHESSFHFCLWSSQENAIHISKCYIMPVTIHYSLIYLMTLLKSFYSSFPLFSHPLYPVHSITEKMEVNSFLTTNSTSTAPSVQHALCSPSSYSRYVYFLPIRWRSTPLVVYGSHLFSDSKILFLRKRNHSFES